MEAEDITDGMLIPWSSGKVRGTIWILAHGRYEAFDREDFLTMQCLVDFASISIRQIVSPTEVTRRHVSYGVTRDLAEQIQDHMQVLQKLMTTKAATEEILGDDAAPAAYARTDSAMVTGLLQLLTLQPAHAVRN